MADYSRLNVSYTYSENSDYSNPRLKTSLDPYESTASTEYEVHSGPIGFSASETIETGGFTTIQHVVVKNNDATNYLSVTFVNAAAATVVLRVLAGQFLVFSDIAEASDIIVQANTAAVDADIVIVGVH
jgi:hypothetical protein